MELGPTEEWKAFFKRKQTLKIPWLEFEIITSVFCAAKWCVMFTNPRAKKCYQFIDTPLFNTVRTQAVSIKWTASVLIRPTFDSKSMAREIVRLLFQVRTFDMI